MKQEPIGTVDDFFDECVIRQGNWDRNLYLYTTPRELSDEEIRQIYIETMESPYTHQQSYFGFARALLKKASEK